MNNLNIPTLLSGGLITNYYCSSHCKHCLYRSSPKWPHDYIAPDQAQKTFTIIKQHSCHSIHIGGGEPLLAPDKLFDILKIANDKNMRIEYVETNSSWYKDHKTACKILNKLIEFGVGTLLVSISPFHNEYIPFSKVKGVLMACETTEMHAFYWTANFMKDLSQRDETKTHTLKTYQSTYGKDYISQIISKYWISPGGRALDLLAQTNLSQPIETLIKNEKGCAELVQTDHFHIDLYGNYIPGLCAGLSINQDDLGRPLDPTQYPLLTLLYNNGIGGLFKMAQKVFSFKALKTHYATKCELCYEIRKFLATKRDLKSKELKPKEHYTK